MPSLWSKEYMDELIKRMNELAIERKEDPALRCRLCGDHLTRSSQHFAYNLDKLQLCEECHKKIVFDAVEELNKRNPRACPKCLSHINACLCPHRKDLRRLKR